MLVLKQLAQRADKEHQPLLRKLRLANDQPLALDLFVVGAHQARGAHIRALAGHFAPELVAQGPPVLDHPAGVQQLLAAQLS